MSQYRKKPIVIDAEQFTQAAFPATYAHEAYHEKTYEAVCAAQTGESK